MQLDTSMHEVEGDEATGYLQEQYAMQLRTVMLAECISFDATKNCVTVQPLMQTKIDGVLQNMPPIADVPVAFYQAGGFVITHSPAKGDVCELHIVDRNIAGWKINGGITDPASSQHHNMNDAVAYFGLNSFNKAIASVKGGMDIRSRDGNVSLNVNLSSITKKVGASEEILSASSYSLKVGGATVMTASSGGVSFGVPVSIQGINFGTHRHSGVQSGGSNSGGPL